LGTPEGRKAQDRTVHADSGAVSLRIAEPVTPRNREKKPRLPHGCPPGREHQGA